jgi:hypothetical protein
MASIYWPIKLFPFLKTSQIPINYLFSKPFPSPSLLHTSFLISFFLALSGTNKPLYNPPLPVPHRLRLRDKGARN